MNRRGQKVEEEEQCVIGNGFPTSSYVRKILHDVKTAGPKLPPKCPPFHNPELVLLNETVPINTPPSPPNVVEPSVSSTNRPKSSNSPTQARLPGRKLETIPEETEANSDLDFDGKDDSLKLSDDSQKPSDDSPNQSNESSKQSAQSSPSSDESRKPVVESSDDSPKLSKPKYTKFERKVLDTDSSSSSLPSPPYTRPHALR